MIKEDVQLLLPEGFEDKMEIITTIFNSTNEVGFVIAGESMHPTSKQPILRIYLLANVDVGWVLQEELQAFAFTNYDNAQSFLENLPSMSALELLLVMNGQQQLSEEPVVNFLS